MLGQLGHLRGIDEETAGVGVGHAPELHHAAQDRRQQPRPNRDVLQSLRHRALAQLPVHEQLADRPVRHLESVGLQQCARAEGGVEPGQLVVIENCIRL